MSRTDILKAQLDSVNERLRSTSVLEQSLRKFSEQILTQLNDENENVNPEADDLLRQLEDFEKDYNDLTQESNRLFAASKTASLATKDTNASYLAADGTASPVKTTLQRKQLNMLPRQRDLKFINDVGQGLLAECRRMQTLVAEKDDKLKEAEAGRAQLESLVEGLESRARHFEESEDRFKEENWNLEVRLQELQAELKAAAESNAKLGLDYSKLAKEYADQTDLLESAKVKEQELAADLDEAKHRYDGELAQHEKSASLVRVENERLQSVVDKLSEELESRPAAGAFSAALTAADLAEFHMIQDDYSDDQINTPDVSPPRSPIKGTPAHHAGLESETLKTSLAHAHRTITNLRTNIHREKTEKMELRRAISDLQEELEAARASPGGKGIAPKKFRSVSAQRRAGTLLGAGNRRSQIRISSEPDEDGADADVNWETFNGTPTGTPGPAGVPIAKSSTGSMASVAESPADGVLSQSVKSTTTETENEGFETAHDMMTSDDDVVRSGADTDDYKTGAESLAEPESDRDRDDEAFATETEFSPKFTHQRNQSSLSSADFVLRPPSAAMSYVETDDDNEIMGTNLLRSRVSRGTLRMKRDSGSFGPANPLYDELGRQGLGGSPAGSGATTPVRAGSTTSLVSPLAGLPRRAGTPRATASTREMGTMTEDFDGDGSDGVADRNTRRNRNSDYMVPLPLSEEFGLNRLSYMTSGSSNYRNSYLSKSERMSSSGASNDEDDDTARVDVAADASAATADTTVDEYTAQTTFTTVDGVFKPGDLDGSDNEAGPILDAVPAPAVLPGHQPANSLGSIASTESSGSRFEHSVEVHDYSSRTHSVTEASVVSQPAAAAEPGSLAAISAAIARSSQESFKSTASAGPSGVPTINTQAAAVDVGQSATLFDADVPTPAALQRRRAVVRRARGGRPGADGNHGHYVRRGRGRVPAVARLRRVVGHPRPPRRRAAARVPARVPGAAQHHGPDARAALARRARGARRGGLWHRAHHLVRDHLGRLPQPRRPRGRRRAPVRVDVRAVAEPAVDRGRDAGDDVAVAAALVHAERPPGRLCGRRREARAARRRAHDPGHHADHDRRVPLQVHAQARPPGVLGQAAQALLLGPPLHAHALLEREEPRGRRRGARQVRADRGGPRRARRQPVPAGAVPQEPAHRDADAVDPGHLPDAGAPRHVAELPVLPPHARAPGAAERAQRARPARRALRPPRPRQRRPPARPDERVLGQAPHRAHLRGQRGRLRQRRRARGRDRARGHGRRGRRERAAVLRRPPRRRRAHRPHPQRRLDALQRLPRPPPLARVPPLHFVKISRPTLHAPLAPPTTHRRDERSLYFYAARP
ncbi:uncharacterized protein V1510DRAFT_390826 [Dipodascopsis tothii]|uniref:uncharacterized protein n=1 Tax=Dipodascopsis tothii TaxID=44089 RepID=UPI0034CF618A